MKAFRIPVMSIQDTRVNLPWNEEFNKLCDHLISTINDEEDNWGLKIPAFTVEFDLERRWYPIFIIENRWLADALIKYIGVK